MTCHAILVPSFFYMQFHFIGAKMEEDTAGAGTKRPADVNGVKLPSPPPMRMKPPPAKRAKTRTSPRAKVCWSALTPELLAKVGTNLAVGTDLVNFCSVVGKDVSMIVKQTYLHRNLTNVWKGMFGRVLRSEIHRIFRASASWSTDGWTSTRTTGRCFALGQSTR